MEHIIVAVGKLKKSYFREAAADYQSRLKRYTKLNVQEVVAKATIRSVPKIKETEGVLLLSKIRPNYKIIALDERGKGVTSVAFASLIKTSLNSSVPGFVYLIGGAHGFDDSVRQTANQIWKLSDFTLPHELARVLLLEQIYRAHTLIRGEPYHKL